MSQESDLKMSLVWETRRPSRGTPRQSSNFLLFGEEWHLKLESDCPYPTSSFYSEECRVRLCSRNGKTTVKAAFSATCHILVDRVAFGGRNQVTVRNPGDIILESNVLSSGDRFSESSKWKVYCHFSCGVEPVPLHAIHLSTGSSSSNPGVQTSPRIPPDLKRLSGDFSRMLDKEIMPDAILTCGDRTWKVHRSVLTARSEVFAAMFHSGMTESETDTVRVKDLDPTVVDSLLKYIYGGKVPEVSCKNVFGLYEASDRYALHGLRILLSGWMVEHLSRDNCLSFLVVADAHSDADLKKAAVVFITEYFAQIEKAEWTDFRNEHSLLAVEVLENFAPAMEQPAMEQPAMEQPAMELPAKKKLKK